MEITWYGLSCFRLTERGLATVVTDPYDHKVVGFSPLKLRGDIVSISHDMPGHNFESAVKPKQRIIVEVTIHGKFNKNINSVETGKGITTSFILCSSFCKQRDGTSGSTSFPYLTTRNVSPLIPS